MYSYYNNILGTPFSRLHSLHLDGLLPQLDLPGIDSCFSEEEIWATIKELPPDRAPGSNGFTGLFYKVAWDTIQDDVVNAFNALWSLDSRSFHLLNDAPMILLAPRSSERVSRPLTDVADHTLWLEVEEVRKNRAHTTQALALAGAL